MDNNRNNQCDISVMAATDNVIKIYNVKQNMFNFVEYIFVSRVFWLTFRPFR